jgi:8-oxo-dGTP pyrophosphatase MutT (NUDIX family)
MTDIRHNFLELLANYPVSGTPETALRQEFLELVSSSADACMRSRLAGHLTGSAWLVSADGRKALLMHHRKLDRWLQPGGHADGDWDLAAVALREAMEETGLPNLHVEPTIFDLDKHRISARGTEPEHWHYDVRFVVRATGSQEFSGNTESWQLRWFDVHDLAQNDGLDESIRRMAHRWLAR